MSRFGATLRSSALMLFSSFLMLVAGCTGSIIGSNSGQGGSTAQTISFATVGNQAVGATVTLSATASSGLPVSFVSETASVCTVSGATATMIASGTCTIEATQAGNSQYEPASAVQDVAVGGKTQTITFANPGAQSMGTAVPALSATASSGLAVSFSSQTTGVCAVSGATVTLLAIGTCSIQATQPGNGTYAAATPVTQSFTVNGEPQTITFAAIASQTISAAPTLTLPAPTASSGLPVALASMTTGTCSVSGTTVTLLAIGTCSIQATQPGNSTYAPAAPVAQSFTINGEPQTITFAAIANQTLATTTTLTLPTPTATSGLLVTLTSMTTGTCSISAATVTLLTAGTCSIQATQPGNSTWAAASPVTQSFTVLGGSEAQTITFNNPGPQTVGTQLTLVATASSGLTVSFASTTTGICTVSAGSTTANFVNAGTCSITASQAGNATYAAATPVSVNFTVNAALVAATPAFSEPAGTYTTAQSISISCTTPNSTIYYTTNDTQPTASSTVYSTAIAVSSTETIEAICTATGYANSAVAAALYTINPSGYYTLPSIRTTTWQPGVTYNGGIPTNRTQCGTTIEPSGDTSGATDTKNIQNALNACTAGHYVLLDSGLFYIATPSGSNAGLYMETSNVTLRGSGAGSTILTQTDPTFTWSVIVAGSQWYHWPSSSNCGNMSNCTEPTIGSVMAMDGILPLTSDAVKETNTITVAASSLTSQSVQPAVGQRWDISEQFDPNYVWYDPDQDTPAGQCGTASTATNSNVNGYCGWGEDWNDSSLGTQEMWASRPLGQANVITGISTSGATTTITFAAPWHHTFRVAYAADIALIPGPNGQPLTMTGIGIEDLTVANGGGGDGGGNIVYWGISNSWIKNVESYNAGGGAIHFYGCFRCELRDSYLHTAGNPNPGGGGYGMEIDSYTADSLFENNISWSFNKVMVMRGAGGGNVIGYNYFEDGYGAGYYGCPSSGTDPQGNVPYTSTCSGIPEAGMNATHMAATQYALFEGNQSFAFSADGTWGNSDYILFFRNHAPSLRRNVNNGAGTDTGNEQYPNVCSQFSCFGPVVQLADTMGRLGIGLTHHQWWYSYVGNVIGYPNNYLQNPAIGYAYPATFSAAPGTAQGSQEQWYFEWEGINNDGAAPLQDPKEYWTSTLWELGNGDGNQPDTPSTITGAGGQTVLNTVIRDGNFDYVTGQTHWMGTTNICNKPGDATCTASNTGNICTDVVLCAGQYTTAPAVSTLPNSLYIPASMQPPPFFNGSTWPWIDGTNASNPIPGTLPARMRFDAGTPNIVPVGGSGTESQTITFANPGTQTVGTPLTLVATASSGLTVSFASTTTNVCTVSAGSTTANFLAAGSCSITATQAGNSTYAAATPVQQSFSVSAASSGDPTVGILPSYNDTYANWKNAGLALIGGIPNRTTICATVNPLGGGQDDYNDIQTAINNCPAGEVVQLAAGAFNIKIADMPIQIPTGITLRGTGDCSGTSSPYCQTSISVMDGALAYTGGMCGTSTSNEVACPNGGQPEILMAPMAPDYSFSWDQCGNNGVGTNCGATPLAADAAQGQTTIQVTSTSGFTVGSWVLIDEASSAGWVADPMNQWTNNGSVWAAADWLSPSGSPATGRVLWAKAENGSWDFDSTEYPYQAGSPGCWYSYCDRVTSELHKVAAIGAGPCPGTNCTLTFDDPLTVAFRESGGHNAQVYATLYGSNYNFVSPISFLEQAGVENLSLLRSPTGGLEMGFCANCWVKNTEVGDWYGGGIEMYYSVRSELNTVYVHHCWDSVNNGGEYPLALDEASTEMLITNSITNFAGKGMVARAGGAGSVVSYNYIDDTMYDAESGIGDYWLDMGINASHYSGPHHVLFEGNWGDNLDNDNTHGNSMYMTFFRNVGSGYRTPFTDPSIVALGDGLSGLVDDFTGKAYYCPTAAGCESWGPAPFRAAGPMGYNYWFAYVGNVLGTSGESTAANGWTYSGDFSASRIFMLGWGAGGGGQDPYLDGVDGSYILINGNYDYLNNAITWQGSPVTLPNSFYLSSEPAFFSAVSGYPWPWVTPTGSSQVQTGPSACGGTCSGLPAQARWQAGTPFVQPGNASLETQTIAFANPGAQTVGTLLTLAATASSGLTVSFTSNTTSVCAVSGMTATFLIAGSCTITASQAGNATYAAAATVPQSFTVNAAPPVLVTSISIPNSATVSVGSNTTIAATVLPANATNQTLTWASSDTATAMVGASGVVSGIKQGTVTVTATATDGSGVVSNDCTVTVTQATSTQSNYFGINIGPDVDYQTNRIFADAMKSSRAWATAASGGNTLLPTSALDANGWPAQDASIYVWAGIGSMQGTYALSFTGQADVTASSGTLSTPVYNSATNQTAATLSYTESDVNSYLTLTFTNTQRTSTSGTNTGITNVVLMRPSAPGSTTPLASTQVFYPPFLAALSDFAVLRTMDYSATNGNEIANWSDRTRPGDASQAIGNPGAPAGGWEGEGGSWEYAILLANTTGKDLWINVPLNATDDYITKLAQLTKYGSDGTTPYTSTQTNPVWPGFNPNLHLYVEFCNEVWNTAGAFQGNENHTEAITEVDAGGSPLNFDGDTNDWDWAWRRPAEKIVDISKIFRSVWGDAAMMATVRPVLESQLGYAEGPLLQEMHLMVDYYDNPNEVSSPQPPNYYIYGLGGSGYYNPTDKSSVDAIFNTMGAADSTDGFPGFGPAVAGDVDYSLPFGVRRIAYEGGPSLDSTGDATEDANQAAAWADPRMEKVIVTEQNVWSQANGDLLVYFYLAGSEQNSTAPDYQWAFMSDVLSPSSPKMSGIADILGATRSTSTYGTPIPATLTASNANVPPAWIWSDQSNTSMHDYKWTSFSVLVSTEGAFTVTLGVNSGGSGAEAEVFVDGNSIGTVTVPTSGNSSALTTPTLTVGSHGIMVRSVAGSFNLDQVEVQAAAI